MYVSPCVHLLRTFIPPSLSVRFHSLPPLQSSSLKNPIPAGDCCCRQFALSAEPLVLPSATVMDAPNLQQAYGAPSYLPVNEMAFAFPQPQQSSLQAFWAHQMAEIEALKDFKNHSLPLARIKRIMKADSEVKMIASEVPVVFSKACELFILEMTVKAWNSSEGNKRRTIQRCDIAAAIKQTEVFDFLVDVIPKDDAPTGVPPAPSFLVPTQPEMMMPLMQDPAYPYPWDVQPSVQRLNSGMEVELQTADKA